jgi:hypothetical protein
MGAAGDAQERPELARRAQRFGIPWKEGAIATRSNLPESKGLRKNALHEPTSGVT